MVECHACLTPLIEGERVRIVPVWNWGRPNGQGLVDTVFSGETTWCVPCADAEGLAPGEKDQFTFGSWPRGFRQKPRTLWTRLRNLFRIHHSTSQEQP